MAQLIASLSHEGFPLVTFSEHAQTHNTSTFKLTYFIDTQQNSERKKFSATNVGISTINRFIEIVLLCALWFDKFIRRPTEQSLCGFFHTMTINSILSNAVESFRCRYTVHYAVDVPTSIQCILRGRRKAFRIEFMCE